MARYIFVTGGVVSSLGKGLSSASLAYLLQSRGFKVRIRKLDPYLNVDPGTMSPFQHGEVFVTDDGAETDLDLGHYERFSGISSKKSDNITTGQIYNDVLYQIGDNSDNFIKSFSNLYFVGPVYIDWGIVLHDKKLVSEKSIKISHDFFISTDKQKLKNLSNINNANYRLFLGHAGWTEGQLENEIANGDWVVQDTSIDFIFNSPEEKMWSTAIESFGIDVSSLSSYSGKAWSLKILNKIIIL